MSANVAVHANPVWRSKANFIIRARVTDVSTEGDFEQLWTRRIDEDRFEVCCIPFFLYGISLGDVVRAGASDGYVMRSVIGRSGNGVARVAIKPDADVSLVHGQIHDVLRQLEYWHEWFAEGYVAINLDSDKIHDELFSQLGKLGELVEVERSA
jgi:hypothetical protein